MSDLLFFILIPKRLERGEINPLIDDLIRPIKADNKLKGMFNSTYVVF